MKGLPKYQGSAFISPPLTRQQKKMSIRKKECLGKMSRGLINTCTPWIWIYKWLRTKRQRKPRKARHLFSSFLSIHHLASGNWWNSFSSIKAKSAELCLSFVFKLGENAWYRTDWVHLSAVRRHTECKGLLSSGEGSSGKYVSTTSW